MIDKDSIILRPCENREFIQVREMLYRENGVQKRWEIVETHDSVAIVIFNADSKSLVIVRQFRPAVFLRNDDGYMFELCAGIIDKNKSLEQIAREEVFEECGYKAESLVKIADFYASVGTSGCKQSIFFTQVRNADKVADGGGIDDEFIEVREIALENARNFLKNGNITPSLAFGFMWFLNHYDFASGAVDLGDSDSKDSSDSRDSQDSCDSKGAK